MKLRLIFWLLLLLIGVLIGDRYGLPSWATRLTDPAFETIESWFGGLGQSLPATEENEDQSAAAPTETKTAAAAEPAPAAAYSGDVGNAANAGLTINDAGLQIIKDSEGLRLEAYSLAGQWLIGYGHAGAKAGQTISEAEADRLLRQDVAASEAAVRRMVLVPVNRNQFSAMVSLAYNLGSGGFSRSSVLEALNKGKYKAAADAFMNHNKAGGVVNAHLTERREKERALFLAPA